MESLPKKYIIGFSQTDHAQSMDAIGLLAQRLQKLVSNAIPIPLGFTVTSHAFDDFLIANSLIEFISTRINNTDYANHSEIKRSSGEIQHAIRTGHMPDIIKNPILKAYSGLGYNDPLVLLKQSPVDAGLAEELVAPELPLVYAKGEENLLEQIKQRWAQLFSVEAMFYRAESGYEGDLSDAIVVQRIVQAESSGILFTVDLVNKYSDIIEIQAILGQYETILKHELTPDSYYVNKKTEEIIQKKIVEQDWMLIKRGRDKEDLDQRITLSAVWSNQQKLDDTSILKLARLAAQIERIFSYAQRIVWAAEAGKIFILDTQQLDYKGNLQASMIIKSIGTEHSAKIGAQKREPEPKKRVEKVDIDAYVREIQKEEHVNDKPSNVEIELENVDKLTALLQGKPEQGKLAFGLCHVIKSQNDWDNLTGDEILVVDKFSLDQLTAYKLSRGVIFLEELNAEQRQIMPGTFVVIQDGTSGVLHEGMVITLDPLTGRVLMGAGREQVKRTEIDKQPVAAIAAPKPVVEMNIPLVIPEIIERDNDIEVDTSTDIWEIFSPRSGKIGKYSKGAYLDLAEVYSLLGFNMAEVAEDRKAKLAFMDAVVAYLKPLLQKLGKRNLLLKLNSGSVVNAGSVEQKALSKDTFDRLLQINLELVAVLRNREGQRNLWIALSNVTSPKHLAELKSALNNAGCRRSATLRVYASLERAIAPINIRELCEVGGDGFILDLPQLLTQLHPLEDVVMTDSLRSFLGFVITQINKSKASSVVLFTEEQMDDLLLKTLVEKGLGGLILSTSLLKRILPKVASLEVKKLRTTKRGRKKKQIDYGF